MRGEGERLLKLNRGDHSVPGQAPGLGRVTSLTALALRHLFIIIIIIHIVSVILLGSDGVGGGSGGAAGWGGVPSPPAAPPKNHGPGQHRRRPHGQPRTRGDPRENTRNSSFFRRRRHCLKNRIIHHHNNNNNNFWFRSCAGGRREPRDTRGTNTPVPPPRLGCPGARCSSSERFWGKKNPTK